jgi:hypothetical protein
VLPVPLPSLNVCTILAEEWVRLQPEAEGLGDRPAREGGIRVKLKTITVGAALTLPHPRYQYASIRTELAMTIELSADDDYDKVLRMLEGKVAEELRRRANELACEEMTAPIASVTANR